ncbi:bifunctional glycosyltransferase family 2/GtrA family protein [Pseudoclavibacter sp. 13-3]|uniref:bifunctional glycosyltransferase family 2/GtrA family protein n=1 Tax=Pseudoclavibacter sp. 13-3 TaxID=2901228 RepID=UPI001E5BB65E|nr:bifunctional glycosyltransferase family 2/GtrA family protein [Pseudoclavibacter sp. 13-3]MCD7102084.1 bifunctional glycosyltransferase family 2/GtrA family protein [Pseudoclavibacter sp. 13-3]
MTIDQSRPAITPGQVRTPDPTQTPHSVLNIVIPVYNEESSLMRAVTTTRAFLDQGFPFSTTITIVDNASTDGTWQVAEALADSVPAVRAVHLDQKGRGLALATAWSAADSQVLAYMDVDLSTDLRALAPLVAPLVSGHSDLAIGTRLSRTSRVKRGIKREFISRSYNLLLHGTLGVRFSDAQCGFKAISAQAARALLPYVHDSQWFFDTELLVIAEKAGLRIHEVPVDWVDDPDSRVDIPTTVRQDLGGIVRLGSELVRGRIPLETIRQTVRPGDPRAPVPTDARTADPHSASLLRQLVRFGLIGIASTALYTVLLLMLQTLMSAQAANLLALLLSTIVNTQANRRLTFGVRSRAGALRHQGQGLVVFALCWLLTSVALSLTQGFSPLVQIIAATVANLVATLLKFLLFRRWVFRPRPAVSATAADSNDRSAHLTIISGGDK